MKRSTSAAYLPTLVTVNKYNYNFAYFISTISFISARQIGFTTDPRFSRSSPYCTDVAKVVNAPIFHVNADDPEAVMHVCTVASQWRNKFKKDVVCYRRHGHNEQDEPSFTQPLMYQKIAKALPVMDKYAQKLINAGVVNQEYVQAEMDHYVEIMETAYSNSQKEMFVRNRDWLDSPWKTFFPYDVDLKLKPTGVSVEVLQHIGNIFSAVPKNFRFALRVGRGFCVAVRKWYNPAPLTGRWPKRSLLPACLEKVFTYVL
ncbi:2-oxoglutarate dehydrogenase E1 component [Trichinella spiralis]|uniref:2-oxoglutarate dehydrogenase E1 component n=1 Tax=Trichinella spiralis TaxID=6334 RepID=UPI0001EFEF64|nr:2-oxoglutarate dehydrogenase E1 component [Trichinella spiralis]